MNKLYILHNVINSVRLSGGSEAWYGVVEVYYEGQWGKICDSAGEWSLQESAMVCRTLGYMYVIF